MQIWLRPYSQISFYNALANELTAIDESGVELQILFEKGDRLYWIELLVRIGFDTVRKSRYPLNSTAMTCLNSELFNQNWCAANYGHLATEKGTISGLFLSDYSKKMGLPLQWLLDEWSKLPLPRSYTRALLKKYQRALRGLQQQTSIFDVKQPHFRDPLLANCTDLICTYNDSTFIHLNSDEEIQPAWLAKQPFDYHMELGFA